MAQFRCSFATDIGLKRQQNQDNGAAYPELGLFVLADGMGGHQGGETASALAAQIIPETIRKTLEQTFDPICDAKQILTEAIQTANRAIFERSQKELKLQGMGTTTTALLFSDHHLWIGHVGDSRCYFFRPHAIWQLTRDHSLVQEKLRAGLITREQLKTDRMKNVITRSVGFEPEVNVDLYEMDALPGDVFLLCSDGLSGQLDDSEILQAVQKELFETGNLAENFNKTTQQLIELANQKGGEDNISIILIQVLPD